MFMRRFAVPKIFVGYRALVCLSGHRFQPIKLQQIICISTFLLLGDISMWLVIGIAIVVIFVFLFCLRPNNCVLIARNLTYIHEILRNEHNGQFPDEDTLLITCGIIDTRSYNFPIEDIKLALCRPKEGKCFLEESQNNISTRNFILLCKKDLFLNFVLELEIMMFLRDTSLRRDDILTVVVSVTEKIEKAIGHANIAYARRKRPLLWHCAVSNFMTSVVFEEVRDQIGIIHPTPEQQLDLLFQELIKRKHWKDIDPEIIKRIFNNAKGDVDEIKRFIFISEIHNSVGNNFIKLAEVSGKDTPFLLGMFAYTLYHLGSDFVEALPSAKTKEEINSLCTRAKMAFTSSILCNPFALESYFGLAAFYSEIDKATALEWCAKYKETENKLLSTPNKELNRIQLNLKECLLDPEEYNKTIREISEKSQYRLGLDEINVDGTEHE